MLASPLDRAAVVVARIEQVHRGAVVLAEVLREPIATVAALAGVASAIGMGWARWGALSTSMAVVAGEVTALCLKVIHIYCEWKNGKLLECNERKAGHAWFGRWFAIALPFPPFRRLLAFGFLFPGSALVLVELIKEKPVVVVRYLSLKIDRCR